MMTITYNGTTVELSEREVWAFSLTIGIAQRAPEAQANAAKLADVHGVRNVWVRLGVLSR